MNHGRATTKSPGRSVNRPARTLALRGVGRGGVVRGAGRRGQARVPDYAILNPFEAMSRRQKHPSKSIRSTAA